MQGKQQVVRLTQMPHARFCYASPHAALLVDLRSDRCVRLR
jgi:hypothetical protein